MTNPTPDQTQQSQLNVHSIRADILKQLSRRKLLRDAAIAATGAVLLPSFITGCSKDNDAPATPIIVGGVEYTLDDLALAAANLIRLRDWYNVLYPKCIEYEDVVFHALASTKTNGNWTNFIVDVF